jgi:hypothetical protein
MGIEHMFQGILSISETLQRCKSTRIFPPLHQHKDTAICISDESAFGWGAYIGLPEGDHWTWKAVQGEWPKLGNTVDPIYDSSTVAEPKAVEMILREQHIPVGYKHVLFVVDHAPLVHAATSVQARCYSYFQTLTMLEKQAFSYNILFIKGEENIADHLSRGRERRVEESTLGAIAAGAGTGYAAALQSPWTIELPHVSGFI